MLKFISVNGLGLDQTTYRVFADEDLVAPAQVRGGNG